MKAVVYHGPGDVRVEERAVPDLPPDGLLVRVSCATICGTDLKLATIGNPRCIPPRIIGHEMAGRVARVGRGVTGFQDGDRVTLATTLACGECAICRRGLGNLCPESKPISYVFDGAFAEYMVVPPLALRGGNVIKVPDGVRDEAAALSEPLSCAINALELAGLKAGDCVLILGGGPLGALHAELAKALGAKDVIVVQRSEPRQGLLRRLRGVQVIGGDDVAGAVRERTHGLGADVVVVSAPSREAHGQALGCVRKGGAISLFASLPKGDSEITWDSRLLHYGEIRVVGASDSRPEHVQRAVRLLSEGRLDVGALITHRVTLDRTMDGIELMRQKQCLKVLVEVEAKP